MRQVPYGKVVTYGQIAKVVPEPPDLDFNEKAVSAARLVGSAMAACPQDVPWHRVINAQGSVSSRADGSKVGKQMQLLEAEGLLFIQGRIDLLQYQWHGADHVEPPVQQQLF